MLAHYFARIEKEIQNKTKKKQYWGLLREKERERVSCVFNILLLFLFGVVQVKRLESKPAGRKFVRPKVGRRRIQARRILILLDVRHRFRHVLWSKADRLADTALYGNRPRTKLQSIPGSGWGLSTRNLWFWLVGKRIVFSFILNLNNGMIDNDFYVSIVPGKVSMSTVAGWAEVKDSVVVVVVVNLVMVLSIKPWTSAKETPFLVRRGPLNYRLNHCHIANQSDKVLIVVFELYLRDFQSIVMMAEVDFWSWVAGHRTITCCWPVCSSNWRDVNRRAEPWPTGPHRWGPGAEQQPGSSIKMSVIDQSNQSWR